MRPAHLLHRYWTVALTGISVSQQAVNVAATTVVIDSGTSAILMGPDDAAAIHKVPSRQQQRGTELV